MLTNQHWCFSKGALTVIALRNVSSRARHLNRMNKISSMETCAHYLAHSIQFLHPLILFILSARFFLHRRTRQIRKTR